HGDVDARRDPALDLGYQRADAIDGLDDVGVALLGDDEQDRRLGIEHGRRARVAVALLDGGHLGEAHDVAVRHLDDDVAVLLERAQLSIAFDGDGLALAVDYTERRQRVGTGDRHTQVLDAETYGGEQHGVGADADGGLLGA